MPGGWVPGPLPAVFPDILVGHCCSTSRAARTGTLPHTGCLHSRCWLNLLGHQASLSAFFVEQTLNNVWDDTLLQVVDSYYPYFSMQLVACLQMYSVTGHIFLITHTSLFSRLSSVNLESAVTYPTDASVAAAVEMCQCPPGYSGSSCEVSLQECLLTAF